MRAACALLWLSCATGGDPAGGGFNLPSAGIVPLTLPEDPLVLSLEGANLTSPWGLVAADGSLTVWMTVTPPEGSAGIGRARGTRGPDGGWAFEMENEAAFVAEADFEGAAVSEPSVTRVDGGLRMAYLTADTAVGIARSSDGETWSRGSSAALAGAWSSPSLVAADDGLALFVVDADGAVSLALSTDDGATFEITGADLLSVPEPEEGEDPIDAAVDSLSVVLTRTSTGRVHYRAHFTSDKGKVGFAAAFADRVFVRFPQNPLLSAPGFGLANPMQAANVLLHSRNVVKSKPSKGLGLGIAYVSDAPPELESKPDAGE